MKLKKYLSLLVICLILSVSLFPVLSYAATIKLNSKIIKLDEGETYQLKLLHTKAEVTWKSDDKTIAKVNKNGKVTAISEGTTKITATSNKKKYTCIVSVFPIIENPPNISSYLYYSETVSGKLSSLILVIKNHGDKTLTLTSDAYVNNPGYDTLSQSVYLIDYPEDKNITFTEKLKIKSGKKEDVFYVSDWELANPNFWLDEDTQLYFNFTYDGIKFHGISTVYSSTDSYKLGYFE